MHLITMSTDLKLSKAQISKIIQPGGFLGQFLGNLLSGKEIVRAGSETKKGKRIVRASYANKWDF